MDYRRTLDSTKLRHMMIRRQRDGKHESSCLCSPCGLQARVIETKPDDAIAAKELQSRTSARGPTLHVGSAHSAVHYHQSGVKQEQNQNMPIAHNRSTEKKRSQGIKQVRTACCTLEKCPTQIKREAMKPFHLLKDGNLQSASAAAAADHICMVIQHAYHFQTLLASQVGQISASEASAMKPGPGVDQPGFV